MPETKRCPYCGKTKPRSDFRTKKTGKQIGQPEAYCRPCETISGREWRKRNRARTNAVTLARLYRTGKSHPMSENRKCSSFLGIHIAEKILSLYFEDIIRMPNNNPGFDFICKNGFKIDAKSSCLQQGERGNPRWKFMIRRNSKSDYFICLGFNNRDDLEPMHVWLVPAKIIQGRHSFGISNNPKILLKWSKYEKPLDNAFACCERMRA